MSLPSKRTRNIGLLVSIPAVSLLLYLAAESGQHGLTVALISLLAGLMVATILNG